MAQMLLWRLILALGAAAFWYGVAWLCFTVAGQDPLDAARGTGDVRGRAIAAAILIVAVIVFALISRAGGARLVKERGGSHG